LKVKRMQMLKRTNKAPFLGFNGREWGVKNKERKIVCKKKTRIRSSLQMVMCFDCISFVYDSPNFISSNS
jgi:hypothetical protein